MVGMETLPEESKVVEAVPPKEAVLAVTLPEKRLVEVALASVVLPVKVGEAESTRLPVPVEPVTSETEETKLASVIVETRFLLVSVATKRLALRPERLRVAP